MATNTTFEENNRISTTWSRFTESLPGVMLRSPFSHDQSLQSCTLNKSFSHQASLQPFISQSTIPKIKNFH